MTDSPNVAIYREALTQAREAHATLIGKRNEVLASVTECQTRIRNLIALIRALRDITGETEPTDAELLSVDLPASPRQRKKQG